MEDVDMLGLLEKTQKAVKALQDGNGDEEELGTYLEKLQEHTGTEENVKTLVIAGLLLLTIETTQTIMTSPNHHLLETCLTILSNIFCFPTITHTLPTLHTAFRLGCIVASSITTPLFVHEAGVSVCNNIAWMCRDVGVVGMLKEEGVLETLLVVFVNQEEVAGSGVAGLLGVNLTLMEGAIGEEAVIELLEHSASIYVAFMVDVLPLYQDLTDASMKKLECFVEWTHRLYSMRLKREFTIDLEKLFQIVFAILGRLPMDIIATPNGNMESWEVDEEMEERKRDFVVTTSQSFIHIIGIALLRQDDHCFLNPPKSNAFNASIGMQALIVGIPSCSGWAVLHFIATRLVRQFPHVADPLDDDESVSALLPHLYNLEKGLEISANDLRLTGLDMGTVTRLVKETLGLLLVIVGRMGDGAREKENVALILRMLTDLTNEQET